MPFLLRERFWQLNSANTIAIPLSYRFGNRCCQAIYHMVWFSPAYREYRSGYGLLSLILFHLSLALALDTVASVGRFVLFPFKEPCGAFMTCFPTLSLPIELWSKLISAPLRLGSVTLLRGNQFTAHWGEKAPQSSSMFPSHTTFTSRIFFLFPSSPLLPTPFFYAITIPPSTLNTCPVI